MTLATTDPETIRAALAARLVAMKPTLAWQQERRWTWTKDREVSGTLRTFDLKFGIEYEITAGPESAYGGGITYAVPVELVVSYPVEENKRDRFIGTDARDLSAMLVRIHESIAGLFAQAWSVDRRVVSTWTGSDNSYIGTHAFTLHFYAADSVEDWP
jgi:hypothetical protein